MDEPVMQLVVVRGWSEELDPRHPGFLQRLRLAGLDVVDLYLPADESPTFDHWANRYVEAITTLAAGTSAPLHLLGYCVGGNLLSHITTRLPELGIDVAYIGLVDTRAETTLQRLQHNAHHRAKAPRRIRFHYFLRSIAPPTSEPLHRILAAWGKARVRTIASLFTKGPRLLRRRREPAWHVFHLSFSTTFPPLMAPVHRYATRVSVDMYGDPTLGTAAFNLGGYVVRIIGGDHYTCLTDPHVDGLVQAIVDDLRDPLPLVLEVDKGQRRPAPRSDR